MKVIEKGESREANESLDRGSTERRVFHVLGTDDLDQMRWGLQMSGRVPLSIRHTTGKIVEFRNYERRRFAPRAWEWIANYADPDRNDEERKLEPGEWRLNFDTTGTAVRMYQSKATVAKYPAGAPDCKGAINVKDGKAEGVDVTIPALKFSITFRHTQNFVSLNTRLTRMRQLSNATGTVNDTAFLKHDPGELLFAGVTGQFGNVDGPELTYHFIGSANATALSFGAVAGVAKQGHDLLWIAYKEVVDAGQLVPQPEFVYVERVYKRGNLAQLLSLQGII